MSNIENHQSSAIGNHFTHAQFDNNTTKIQKLVQYLYDMRPALEKEYDDLASLQASRPNEIFPIKMEALATVYKAIEPLYMWYIDKVKNRPA